jgi:hypothetical protein
MRIDKLNALLLAVALILWTPCALAGMQGAVRIPGPGGAGGAPAGTWTLIQKHEFVGAGTSATDILTSAVTAGNLVAVCLTVNANVSAVTVTDGHSGVQTYTASTPNGVAFQTGAVIKHYGFYFLNNAGGINSNVIAANWTTTSPFVWMSIAEFHNTNTPNQTFDKDAASGTTDVSNSSTGVISTPALIPNAAGNLLVACTDPNANATDPTTGGTRGVWTGTILSASGPAMEHELSSSSSSTAVNFLDNTTSDPHATIEMSFKPSQSSISLVQHPTPANSSGQNPALAFAGSTTTGNLIIVAVRQGIAGVETLNSVTDSCGDTFVSTGFSQIDGGVFATHLFYAKNITGCANTVTLNYSSAPSSSRWEIYEYHGLDTASPLDQSIGAQGTGNTSSSGNVTTTSANELAFAVTGYASLSNPSAGGSFVYLDDLITGSIAGATESKILTSPQTIAGSFATTGGPTWGTVIATFK